MLNFNVSLWLSFIIFFFWGCIRLFSERKRSGEKKRGKYTSLNKGLCEVSEPVWQGIPCERHFTHIAFA